MASKLRLVPNVPVVVSVVFTPSNMKMLLLLNAPWEFGFWSEAATTPGVNARRD
jgi:hypothetical protein